MAEPLVSVCIQAYQHEKYIQQCLESVLRQKTNFPFEIIVGEDESSDETRSICKKIADQHPDQIRLFLRSRKDVIYINDKPSGRFNLIENYRAAQGKYIAMLDGDDYWTDENKLQLQIDFLESHPDFSLCFTNASSINGNGAILKKELVNYKEDIFIHETFVAKISPPTLTCIFRKSALSLDFPEAFYKIINADMFIKAMISEKGKTKFINKITAHKRLHGSGIYAGTSYLQKEENKLRTYSLMLTYFTSAKVRGNLKNAMGLSYARLQYYYLIKGNVWKFFISFFKSIGFYISNKKLPPLRLVISKLKTNKAE